MSLSLKTAAAIAGLLVAAQAGAQVTFYSRHDFHGQQFTTDRQIRNLERFGFNDSASSAVVRGGQWQVCEDAAFSGRCAILQPGEYPTLASMGLNNEISSVREVGRYGAIEDRQTYVAQGNDYSRRSNERLYQVPVVDVRAVVGPPEQRCWVERRDFRGNANVPGAIAGAVIGGILGHQIGGGRGQDVATAGGAVAGAAVGSNVGRDRDEGYSRDVQRCTDVSQYDRPDYWDVTYTFRGQEHHVQMTAPPGSTITVNENGDPRG
jgi:uncharacterized protein YcfJ